MFDDSSKTNIKTLIDKQKEVENPASNKPILRIGGCSLIVITAILGFSAVAMCIINKGAETAKTGAKTVEVVAIETGKTVRAPWELLKECIESLKGGAVIDITTSSTAGHTVAELNTYSREVVVRYSYSTSWWGSSKKLTYAQKYEAKYGINLDTLKLRDNEAVFEYKSNEDAVIITSLTPVGMQNDGSPAIESEDGWWNKLQDSERAKIEASALAKARKQAYSDDAAKRAALDEFVNILNKTKDVQSGTVKFILD